MDKLNSGTALEPNHPLDAMVTLVAAATFGKGHFEGAYAHPDNEWLGVDTFEGNEIEEATRLRVTEGKWAVRSGTDKVESMNDVAGGMAEQFKGIKNDCLLRLNEDGSVQENHWVICDDRNQAIVRMILFCRRLTCCNV